jgi:hypothetical protein
MPRRFGPHRDWSRARTPTKEQRSVRKATFLALGVAALVAAAALFGDDA